jgi:hypothetical protein
LGFDVPDRQRHAARATASPGDFITTLLMFLGAILDAAGRDFRLALTCRGDGGHRWLRPRLIATIDYLERTAANHMRQPRFAGLSEPRQ